ncbi:HI0074 family nucleotidyltransferase substrate-binding subunit [Paracraurococcus lichenis]|uniref:HI0074 family nucleotidyltransferase substrate-binding subunit n=1 Tax=Paracraurococcus lichenis TaxID=3064888 RepID=A0ABT9E6B3_9PROT|nr:HI0074 family nucleotidyltransferase substrate-binding subunit [Paracraurococcus sp. LOR1-02]MDO9711657.1 HI0074 family nucleotidyltransferase substrate-binding subunit [Paracraurococcus sp. LOR1-02]
MNNDPEERRAILLRAMDRFEEVLAKDLEAEPALVDSAIQRFEFSIELFWRLLQSVLEREGVRVASPRAAFRAAYAQGWLDGEAIWLAMIDDRNRTSHTYDEGIAQDVLSRLPSHLQAMREALARIPRD